MANIDRPGRLTQVPFHGPLSQARAAQLTERLTRNNPGTVLDIGCGWGELMLRILAAAPDATGVGIDIDDDDLARGRDGARARGLDARVTFARESGVGTARGPADLVLCVGASQALSEVQPPGHIAAALAVLRRLVTPGGRVLLGEGFWQHPPTAAELAAMWPGMTAGELLDLADIADLAVAAGFRPAWIETASETGVGGVRVGLSGRRGGMARHPSRSPRGRRDQAAGRRAPLPLAARLPRPPGLRLPHSGPGRLTGAPPVSAMRADRCRTG